MTTPQQSNVVGFHASKAATLEQSQAMSDVAIDDALAQSVLANDCE